MKYDDLVEQLGEFGPYQLRVYFFSVLPALIFAIQSLLPVFVLGQPRYRCAIPGLDNDTYQTQGRWHQQLINYTLPWTDAIGDDDTTWGSAKCSVYKDRTASNFPGSDSDPYPGNGTESCHRWVYEQTEFDRTFVRQENLVCDDSILRAHANMAFMGGLLVGSFFFGSMSDRFGRKFSFMVAMAMHVAVSVSLAFSQSFLYFAILRFFNGFTCMGIFVTCFVLGMELVGKKYRGQAGLCIQFPWCFGLFVLNFVAYFVRDWQKLQLVLSCYTVLFLLLYWIIPESPRWQISKGQLDKARATIEKAAKVNKVELPPGAFESVEDVTEERGKLSDIFKSRVLAIRIFVIFVNWCMVTMAYYGLSLSVGSLGGNVYVNFALSSSVETLSNFLTLWALPRLGRKKYHCFCMILGGSANLALMIPSIIGDGTPLWVTLLLSNVGKFGATGGFATIYVFTAELFPTSMRNTVVGASSMIARLGGIAAPYIADLGLLVGGKFGTALPFIVFGASSLVAGFMALTLPETLNQPTPETMDDAINFGKYKPEKNRQDSALNGTLSIAVNGKQHEMREFEKSKL